MKNKAISQSITERSTKSISVYLKEINRFKVLTPEQEVELFTAFRGGDNSAKEKLIQHNLRFVVSVAKQYQNQGLTLEDLISEGNFGLMKAIDDFDETRGFKFITFAVWKIRQSILQALTDLGHTIRIPASQLGLINKINLEMTKYESTHGYAPTMSELSDIVDIPEEKITEILNTQVSTFSIDKSINDETNETISDNIENIDESLNADDGLDKSSLTSDLMSVLNKLDPLEKQVLLTHYGLGCTPKDYDQLSDEMGVTKERVHQIRNDAIKKIREMDIEFLKKYLG